MSIWNDIMSGRNDSAFHLIDSNIFLRVFMRDNETQWHECSIFLKAVAEGSFSAYVPSIVPVEIQFVMSSFYRVEKKSVVAAIKSVVTMNHLQIMEDVSLSIAVDLYERYTVKFIDCLLASSARVQKRDATIVSYDRDFDKLGVKRVEPKQLL